MVEVWLSIVQSALAGKYWKCLYNAVCTRKAFFSIDCLLIVFMFADKIIDLQAIYNLHIFCYLPVKLYMDFFIICCILCTAY